MVPDHEILGAQHLGLHCTVFPSLHLSQLAQQAGAYLGFCSIKCLEILLLPPGWDASPSQGYPQH